MTSRTAPVSDTRHRCRRATDDENFKRRRCNKSFVLLPLVCAYGLIQISSNLVNPHHLHANAARVALNSTHQTNHDKDRTILALNSTNFNTELIQYQNPFPHIKVIEYYLPYCGICRKFKQIFVHLSKEIYSWRNVIRLAELNVGVSTNAPIIQSWSIEVVPTLRIHPILNRASAENLNHQLVSRPQSMKDGEFQKLMFHEYTASAKLMVQTLDVLKYTNDKLDDKVHSLKQDLLRHMQRFIKDYPNDIPDTWPNFKPVTEKTLAELKRNHPRQELFLIVELSDDSQPDSQGEDQLDLGFQVMMGLSSSAAWRAVRYVRARDNKDLIGNVLSSQEHTDLRGTDLLEALVQGKKNRSDNLVLIHIDDSNSTKFPFLELITSDDIIAFVNETYVSTREDRDFLIALNKFDEDPTSYSSKREATEKLKTIRLNAIPLATNKSKSQEQQTKLPLDRILLGVPMSLYHVIIMAMCLSSLIVSLRCASYYIERQRRHKASMLNGVQYSLEMQS